MKVLIVEDFDDTRAMLKLLLELKGWDVIEAVDGLEGIGKAVEYLPDVILMDLNMPVLDGISAAIEIRKNEQTTRIPIVAVSAHIRGDWRLQAAAAGFNDYMVKPIDIETLSQVMGKFVQHPN
jgi:two-component system, cell cycle response regulator DivK